MADDEGPVERGDRGRGAADHAESAEGFFGWVGLHWFLLLVVALGCGFAWVLRELLAYWTR
ncbi:MAG: hypothetical protein KC583_15160 [Myxococcales bacterium]|nr:hypothetical protein [Myxococcales bacterium]